MFEPVVIDDLDAEGLLCFVEESHRARLRAAADQLQAAAHWAVLNGGLDLDGQGRVLPGMERLRQLGGDGTPGVAEFAAAEFGAVQEMSPVAAEQLITDAVNLRHRHPRLWARVGALEVEAWKARKIAQETHRLSFEACRWLDAEVAESAGWLPFGRLMNLVRAKVIQADPAAAEARRKAAEAELFVRTGQSDEHGLKTLVAKAKAGDVIWFVAMCDRIARVLGDLGDTDPIGVRRATAVGILAQPARALGLLEEHAAWLEQTPTADDAEPDDAGPDDAGPDDAGPDGGDAENNDEDGSGADADPVGGRCPTCDGAAATAGDPTGFRRPAPARIDPRRLLPPATLYLHLSQGSFSRDAGGVARFENGGPITVEQAREFLGHCQVTITPVIDLPGQAPVDGYQAGPRLRQAVHLACPADVFPYAANLGRGKDLDHSVPYLPLDRGGPPGQTGLHNLAPLVRFHHRIKTHGRWRLRQPRPGTYLWRTPHGRYLLVDHTGTHRLDRAVGAAFWAVTGPPVGPTTSGRQPAPEAIHADHRHDNGTVIEGHFNRLLDQHICARHTS